MTRDILIILHSEVSTPGRIGHMLQAMGFTLDIRRPCLGEVLPETMEHHAGAVIFGGPMSANDSDDWIAREIDWIGVPLKEKKPFLGVCLGAQMLSKHLGGTVGPHADGLVEIGYYSLTPTEQGRAHGPWPAQVYHWHREGLTLPTGAVRLAVGQTFENQAFRYNGAAYGIQFHPEVTRLTMHRWGVLGAHRFVLPNAQDSRAHLEGQLLHDAAVKDWLSQFLSHWLNSSS
ncbi:glutamine amidotransferase [Aestuariivirga sp.]|uniref:glutamine amidotransferase n=1 Tax=Aestuariivirga sp. TaxID=2650926 RepID=UPI003BAB7AF9